MSNWIEQNLELLDGKKHTYTVKLRDRSGNETMTITLGELREHFESFEPTIKLHPRQCTTCGAGMSEGYFGEDYSYGCSDECWFSNGYTREQYQADFENDTAYWTEWEELDDEMYDSAGNLYSVVSVEPLRVVFEHQWKGGTK